MSEGRDRFPYGVAPATVSVIETDSFPLEFVSELAELESWRKEVYRPVYHIHKWWANRLGSVFRAIILASVLPDGADLPGAFYSDHCFADLRIFDPFMGSGTTIGEAHKLGAIALGRDINPVAYESVRVALGPLDRHALLDAFAKLSSGVGEQLRGLYRASLNGGAPADVLYFFWVKVIRCPHCEAPVDLFPSYVFARNAYPDRKPEVRVYCPQCASVFTADGRDEKTACPQCGLQFDPRNGTAAGAAATCPACSQRFQVAKAVQAVGSPPDHRLFAKLVLTGGDAKVYLPIGEDDVANYQRCSAELASRPIALPSLALADGYNTRQALNYCYHEWREFFNDRQLLALGMLHSAILELPDEHTRDALLTVFSGALEFNNMFASYKGEGTGAIRHMFSHHILKPERLPIEGNVWGTHRSSGSFSTLFKSRLLRAIDYRLAPFEVAAGRLRERTGERKVFAGGPPFTGQVATGWPPPAEPPSRSIYLSCGSSDITGLADRSVDLVITDPPFFDNVHYSELADFFYAWQQLRPGSPSRNGGSTRHPREVQDVGVASFAAKLRAVFSECGRVLKDSGLLVFTYHHSRGEGWSALADAVLGAGFAFMNAHPVKAEMSVAAPKAQAKEPIQLDVVMVCRKRALDSRCWQDAAACSDRAVSRARLKAERLSRNVSRLSVNDRRVILISHFLVEASPGRTSAEVADELRRQLPALDSAALELLTSDDAKAALGSYAVPAQRSPEQLVLFDSGSQPTCPPDPEQPKDPLLAPHAHRRKNA